MKLSAPNGNFTIVPGEPITITGVATCPADQTPEYQYWFKHWGDANWTRLTPRGTYLPGSTSWTPPTQQHWCVTVVARAVGAPEEYQVRANSRCSAPVCGNGDLEAGEACEDGNLIDGDGCSSACALAACGDGTIDPGETCDDGNVQANDGCGSTCQVETSTYFKASNPGKFDFFGAAVALSADGLTLAVGADSEDGSANGIGEAFDDGVMGAGAVYVYTRASMTAAWSPPLYIKSSNTYDYQSFGNSVALSADGSILAVGAMGESSGTGEPTDHSATLAGAVYVFARSNGAWTQQAYLKAAHPKIIDAFGAQVALSSDGATLVATAPFDDSAATGVNGNDTDEGAWSSGAAYIFTRSGTAWTQVAYLKASNTDEGDEFGTSAAISGDGATVIIGAPYESSSAKGVDGNQSNNSATDAGAVYVFGRTGNAWAQQHYIKASNTGSRDYFGAAVALSRDGATIAVGAPQESSAASGVGGNQQDNSKSSAGAAYVFARKGGKWTQSAYVKATNPDARDRFGTSVALSANGALLACTAIAEDSGRTPDPSDNTQEDTGALYTYALADALADAWAPKAFVKAPNADAGDQLGTSVAIASDGTIAVSATGESSNASGVGGDPQDNSAPSAGAVYLFRP